MIRGDASPVPTSPDGDIVYWRGQLADHSRPISQDEFDKLRRLGLRNLRNFYRSLWGVAAFLLVSFELSGGYPGLSIVGFAVGTFGLLFLAITQFLLPGKTLQAVSRNACAMRFPDHTRNSRVDVVVPGGIVLDPAPGSLLRPAIVELSYAAPPSVTDASSLPMESWRELTQNEASELLRRQVANSRSFWLLGLTVLNILLVSRKALPPVAFYTVSVLFFFALGGLLLTERLCKRSRKQPQRLRIVREAVVDGRRVAYAEFVEDQSRPWTIDGEPADWRKR